MSIITTRNRVRASARIGGIQSQFIPGGDIWKTARRWARETELLATMTTPVRTGNLARSFSKPRLTPQALQVQYTLVNDERYAIFVHEGTHGPIRPRNATGKLWVRPMPHSRFAPHPWYLEYGGRHPLDSVDGQRANPWMREAMNAILRAHGAS